jgi:hypothetical protein
MRPIDLTGTKVGRITVLSLHGAVTMSGARRRTWLCRCDCGTEWPVLGMALLSRNTTSCGCAKIEALTTHGQTHAPEYRVWWGMLGRCAKPNNSRFRDYGGRGIKVCDRWKTFENFRADIGPRPDARFSIDRIDNDGNYEPDNCKWSTRSEQQRNKRLQRNNTSGVTGVYAGKKPGTWVARIRNGRKNIYLGVFDSIAAAALARNTKLINGGQGADYRV